MNKHVLTMVAGTLCFALLTGCIAGNTGHQTNTKNTEISTDKSLNVSTKKTINDSTTKDLEHALADIPNDYQEIAKKQGRVVRINYKSNSYDSQNKELAKYAFVYLPYGYDENDKEKNIMYFI